MKNYRPFSPPGQLGLRARRAAMMPHSWLRLWNGFADDPKWRRVASDAGAPLGDVIATVAKLLEVANIGRPRGSVAEFSPAEWALSLGVERSVVDSIWTVLTQIGWIDREHVTKWERFQPDREDPTRNERQARYRERKRLERQGRAASPSAESNAVASVAVTLTTPLRPTPQHPQSDRDERNTVASVAVTPRADTDHLRELPKAALSSWLYGAGKEGGEGLFHVMRGCQRGSELYARNHIARWLAILGGDLGSLAQIIQATAGQAVGPAYEELVAREVSQQAAIARERMSGQASLMLPIVGRST